MKGLPSRYGPDLTPSRVIYPSSKLSWYIGLLIVAKALRCVGLFLTYDLLKAAHVAQLLCAVKLLSGICFTLIQKPFTTGKQLVQLQFLHIFRHAVFSTALNLLWFYGLTLCGPLRTILVYENAEVVVIAAIGALFVGAGGPARLRGAVCFLMGAIALLLFDFDDLESHSKDHPEGQQHHGVSHVFYHLFSWMGLADHKGGVVLLLVITFLQIGFNTFSRRLSVDIGGAKRLHALSTLFSGILLIPYVMYLHFTQKSDDISILSLGLPVILIAIFVFVLEFYIEALSVQRLESLRAARISSVSMFVCSLLLTFLWQYPYIVTARKGLPVQEIQTEDHALSGGVIFSCMLYICAAVTLTSAEKGTIKGHLVGYSSTGLPLYNLTSDALHQTSRSVVLFARTGLKQILEDSNSRKIFYFLCLNLSFTFVEFMYGVWTNSLGLISDGFHMLFDCSALVMGLYASVIARWKPSKTFSFGYDRVEVLSGFVNGLFLLVISCAVLMEAISRLWEPPDIVTDRLLTVSVAGLLVNLIGVFAFSHGHSHGHGHFHGHGHSGHGHGHGGHDHEQEARHHHHHAHSHNTNMQGVFLHIVADTLGSIGVIFSSILIERYNLLIADPCCSVLIALLIFVSVIPLLKESSLILLLRTPPRVEGKVASALQKVLSLEGVISYREPRFWQQSSEVLVGSLHVEVTKESNEQKIIQQVTAIYRDLGFQHFSVQVEKQEYHTHISGLGTRFHTKNSMLGFSAVDAANMVKAV